MAIKMVRMQMMAGPADETDLADPKNNRLIPGSDLGDREHRYDDPIHNPLIPGSRLTRLEDADTGDGPMSRRDIDAAADPARNPLIPS